MSMADAYSIIIDSMASHKVVIFKNGSNDGVEVPMAMSSVTRKLEGSEETSYAGYEVVFTKKSLDSVNFGVPRKGDVIESDLIGDNMISFVKPEIVLGSVVGYRVRLS